MLLRHVRPPHFAFVGFIVMGLDGGVTFYWVVIAVPVAAEAGEGFRVNVVVAVVVVFGKVVASRHFKGPGVFGCAGD